MSPPLSRRGRLMPASPIRRLVPLADRAVARGVRVLHLNIGQPDLETPAPIRERLAAYPDKVLAYSPSGGTAEYLAFLVEYYARLGLAIEPRHLVATTGGSEAILFAMSAITDPGDEVVVVEPFYTNYAAFAAMAGVSLAPVTASGDDGFHLPPPAAFEAVVTPRTRALLLCNPGNPTGAVYTADEIRWAASFCRERGLFLVVDEVYREFAYDGRVATSALSLEGCDDLVIVVDSLSKRYSACGIRLGCLVTRNEEVQQAALRMAQGRLSPPGIAQFIAVGARALGPEYTRAVVTEYQARRDVLYEGIRSIPGASLAKPEGAFYFIAKLPVTDSDDFARFLLTDFERGGATVMVAPAGGFYATPGKGADEVRIAYVLKEADLRLAVELLGEALTAYRRARA